MRPLACANRTSVLPCKLRPSRRSGRALPLQAQERCGVHQCWPYRSLDSQCCPATRRRSGCTACWYETLRREEKLLRQPTRERPPSRRLQPRRVDLLLFGLSPSSYISWTYLLACLQQFSGGGVGNFFLMHFLYGKRVRPSQAHTSGKTKRDRGGDLEKHQTRPGERVERIGARCSRCLRPRRGGRRTGARAVNCSRLYKQLQIAPLLALDRLYSINSR